jgi:hypothetical protein
MVPGIFSVLIKIDRAMHQKNAYIALLVIVLPNINPYRRSVFVCFSITKISQVIVFFVLIVLYEIILNLG